MRRTTFIVNPNAGNGAASRHWAGIRGLASRRFDALEVRMTRGPGDAVRFAVEAVRSGAGLLVCVGGDGTLNEVVNGLLEPPLTNPGCILGYIPCGTGCDLSRSLSIPRDPVSALEGIAHGAGRTLDVGKIAFRGNEGKTLRRFFHNVVSFGLGGEVDERVNRSSKRLGGFLSFICATVVATLLYRKKSIRIQVDEGPVIDTVAWNIAVANGQYHGGGMWVAPEARVDDGLLNVTVIGDLARWQVFLHLPKLYNGRLHRLPQVRFLKGARIRAWSGGRVLLDVDGEQPGRLPAVMEAVPGAVRLACPRPL